MRSEDSALLAALFDDRRDLGGAALAREPGDDAGAINLWTVLAHLPFAFERLDNELESDDRLQHGIDVIGRRVAHMPGLGAALLMDLGEARDDPAQALGVVEEAQPSRGVDRDIVPGRHHLAVLGLGWIPAGRDVALGAEK